MRAVYSHPDAVAMVSAGRTLPDVLGGNPLSVPFGYSSAVRLGAWGADSDSSSAIS